jgi:hypothetical protein
MIETFNFEQGTDEWFACRLGIPTASCFKDVLAKGQGKTRRTYMLKLIGERLTGECQESYSNAHMERGHVMEEEARNLYEFQNDVEVEQVGFIRNVDFQAGYSPDGVVGESGLVEIKSKLPHLQIDVLLLGELPSEHKAQVQGGLWVSEREWCDFVSYWPKLPLFVKRVYRDEKYINDLASAVAGFWGELLELEAKIKEM